MSPQRAHMFVVGLERVEMLLIFTAGFGFVTTGDGLFLLAVILLCAVFIVSLIHQEELESVLQDFPPDD